MILWAVFAYVKYWRSDAARSNFPIGLLVAPPFLSVGAAAGKFSFDLETTNGFFHYAFYRCRDHDPGSDCRPGMGVAVT